MLASGDNDPEKLVANSTTLMRRVVEIVIHDADLPSDKIGSPTKGQKVKARLKGERLRTLLRSTAVRMTVGGKEVLSQLGLSDFLTEEGVIAKDACQDTTVLSELIASFHFKAGPCQGCEFQHKSLREYLFAEAFVEDLRYFLIELPRPDAADSHVPHLKGTSTAMFDP